MQSPSRRLAPLRSGLRDVVRLYAGPASSWQCFGSAAGPQSRANSCSCSTSWPPPPRMSQARPEPAQMGQELGGAANCPQHKSAPSPVGSVSSWRRSSTLRPLSPPRTAPRIVPTGSDGQGPCKTGLCRVSAPSSDSLMPVAHTTLVFIRMRSCTAQGTPAKRPRSCPWRPGPLRAPRRAPELRYSKAKRPATVGSNSRCILFGVVPPDVEPRAPARGAPRQPLPPGFLARDACQQAPRQRPSRSRGAEAAGLTHL